MKSGDRELIDLYLRGELQGDALNSFSAQLKSDAVLRRELDHLVLLLPGIHESGRAMLKSKLQTIEASLPAFGEYTPAQNDQGQLPARKGKWGWKMWALIAGGVIILAAAGLWWWQARHAEHQGPFDFPSDESEQAPSDVNPSDAVPAVKAPSSTPDAIADSLRADSVQREKIMPSRPAADTSVEPAGGAKNAKAREEEARKKQPAHSASAGSDIVRPLTMSYFDDWTKSRSESGMVVWKDPPASDYLEEPPQVLILSNAAYPFHYRCTGNMIYLYGPFKKEELLWGSHKQTLVLLAEGKRYQIKPTATVTSLKDVEIPTTLTHATSAK